MKVLTESKVVISKLLPEKASSKFESYISNFTLITSQLRSFIYKAMCPQLHSAISVSNYFCIILIKLYLFSFKGCKCYPGVCLGNKKSARNTQCLGRSFD